MASRPDDVRESGRRCLTTAQGRRGRRGRAAIVVGRCGAVLTPQRQPRRGAPIHQRSRTSSSMALDGLCPAVRSAKGVAVLRAPARQRHGGHPHALSNPADEVPSRGVRAGRSRPANAGHAFADPAYAFDDDSSPRRVEGELRGDEEQQENLWPNGKCGYWVGRPCGPVGSTSVAPGEIASEGAGVVIADSRHRQTHQKKVG